MLSLQSRGLWVASYPPSLGSPISNESPVEEPEHKLYDNDGAGCVRAPLPSTGNLLVTTAIRYPVRCAPDPEPLPGLTLLPLYYLC